MEMFLGTRLFIQKSEHSVFCPFGWFLTIAQYLKPNKNREGALFLLLRNGKDEYCLSSGVKAVPSVIKPFVYLISIFICPARCWSHQCQILKGLLRQAGFDARGYSRQIGCNEQEQEMPSNKHCCPPDSTINWSNFTFTHQ